MSRTPGVVAVLNGPNLNLLGEREPERYGTATLADVRRLCEATAAAAGLAVDFRQTNHEGVLVDQVQELRSSVVGMVVNAAALTHTSVALRDALAVVRVPVVEAHLTHVHAREDFRRTSYLSDVACAVIAGCGPQGYAFAVQHVAALAATTMATSQPEGQGRRDVVAV